MHPELLVALPIAIPLVAAVLCLLGWRRPGVQRDVALLGFALMVAAAAGLVGVVARQGPVTIAIGGWPAPIGIAFRADLLAALMTLVAAVIGAAVAIYAVADAPATHQRAGFWPLVLLLVLGVCGSFLTADLFNLFVWFEVMLVASFVLLGLGSSRAQLAGTHVYLVLSVIGSTLLLIGVGLVYATVRTLDLTQLGDRMAELSATRPGLVLAIEALLLTSFGLKAAVFPLMSWLPASYHTPLPAVSALFAALLTKVGVYALIRMTAAVFAPEAAVHAALVAIAIATMLVGVLGALAQPRMREILGFHIVSQIGYMVAGLALATGTPAARRFALAAALFYVVHHILVKANLFLIAGVVRRTHGTEALDRLGGVARSHPWLAAMFLVSALSLAGVPPLSGFWAKLAILAAGIEQGRWVLVAVAVAVGLLTLISMLKLWTGVFAGTPPSLGAFAPPHRRAPLVMYVGITLLAALTLAISLAPQLLFELALAAADQLRPRPGSRPRSEVAREDARLEPRAGVDLVRPQRQLDDPRPADRLHARLRPGRLADADRGGARLPPPAAADDRVLRLLRRAGDLVVAADRLGGGHPDRPSPAGHHPGAARGAHRSADRAARQPRDLHAGDPRAGPVPRSANADRPRHVPRRSRGRPAADQARLRALGAEDPGMSGLISIAVGVGMTILALAIALSFIRLVQGPTLADRVLAVDVMTIAGVGLMAISGIAFDAEVFLDIALILVVAGFVATAAFAQLVEENVLRTQRKEPP